MRPPILRTFDLADDELVIDNFAGGGGASTGIQRAIGRPVDIAIVDIGTRMLEPHELFLGQGFPRSYDLGVLHNGKPLTKTALTLLAGNAVNPELSYELTTANLRGGRRAAA